MFDKPSSHTEAEQWGLSAIADGSINWGSEWVWKNHLALSSVAEHMQALKSSNSIPKHMYIS